MAVEAQSFDEIRRAVDTAIIKRWGPDESGVDQPSAKPWPWLSDLGPTTAIVQLEGKTYAVPYTLTEDGDVTLGEMSEVDSAWVKPDGSPVLLHAIDVQLGDGEEAEPDKDDGLIWKELIRPGAWFKMDSGHKVEVTEDIIAEAFRAFEAGLPQYLSVPTDRHYPERGGDVPPESNRGFVRKMKLLDGGRAFGGFEFTKEDVRASVLDGSIADCSVYIQRNVTHPGTGETFGWAFRHVLLTNNPLVQGLEGWQAALAASGEDATMVLHYHKSREGVMTEKKKEGTGVGAQVEQGADAIMLTGDAKSAYNDILALGLSADEIKALAAERDAVSAKAAELRAKARDMEVSRVVKAMEGVEDHPAVVQLEGYRHYPVVIEAVKKALADAPQALALSADDEGQTGIDTVILDVANAIPAEGRVRVAQQPAGDKNPAIQAKASGDGQDAKEVTDEQLDDLDKQIYG